MRTSLNKKDKYATVRCRIIEFFKESIIVSGKIVQKIMK